MTYNQVPAQIDLPKMEYDILDFWRTNNTFAKSLAATATGTPWTFYEGPPTANGKPGTHHLEARVFKDVFPRFKTMQGYRVDRKAGWDCHGLPVELAVEKELGISGKPDIERIGIQEFNERCRESVTRHVDAFAEVTTRMGYWVNMDDAYWTMSPDYVQSVWWALKQIHAKGLLSRDYRVAPYCPRCGTTLSDHELAQGYEEIIDPSVYVRFPITSGPLAGKADLLVWTTTPWTLVSNTAVAVHPDVTYVLARKDDDAFIIAEQLAEKVLGEGWTLTGPMQGSEMELWTYQRPFDLVEFPDVVGGTHYVVLADYVTTSDGTGLVHQAPAFGADDMLVSRSYGLPLVNPIRSDGTFEADLPLIGGLFFRDANDPLIADLDARGLLFRKLDYRHSYPHCWRCHTALLYYAQPAWYIRTTQIKDELLRENDATTWYPETIKYGRYGDWLNNNIDWSLSRTRYWGTPLPIWICAEGHETAVGSLAELSQLTNQDHSELDPHRPFVDEVTFLCPKCQHQATRVSEVIDAWFDSGSMPFAQWGYPWAAGSSAALERAYPADFIAEAIDQTRGWFYSLMAIGTLTFDRSPYKNVLCLGHILAEDGRKMSKHLGNILEPIPLMDRHGADAVRWFMAASGSPWSSRRVGHGAISETVRKVLLTYWNTVAFHALYARASDWLPNIEVLPISERHILDRWLTSATQQLIIEVTAGLEVFDTQLVGAKLSEFIDDLSNWYVRRSRRRFWAGEPSALQTLHETLHVLTRLMAPLTPFITERVWQDLFVAAEPSETTSVHLSSWPIPDDAQHDPELVSAMALVRRLVELGRAARAEARVKTRQPLRRLLISSAAFSQLTPVLIDEICAELNVERVESFAHAGDLVSFSAKGNFRNLGKRFGKDTPTVAAAIADCDAAVLAAALLAGTATVFVPQLGEIALSEDDVIVSERPREGWSVINEQGETVALDLELTQELIQAGLAREVIRAVQEARKNAGLQITDRIKLILTARGPLAEAINSFRNEIAEEVLATDFAEVQIDDAAGTEELGLQIALSKV